MTKQKLSITFFLIFLLQSGCTKLIEVDSPVTSTNAGNVYTSDATAAAVLTGIYTRLSTQNTDVFTCNLTSISIFAGLSADELTLYNLNHQPYSFYYSNNLSQLTSTGAWNTVYPIVFFANAAIEGLKKAPALTPAVRQQLLGEAYFLRAFCYFYLVNLYGDVPLVLTTDYTKSVSLPRTTKAQVYEQILADLREAPNLLSDQYLKADALSTYTSGMEERVRPTKWAALALLARVYLFTGKYVEAEASSTAVINHSALYNLSPLNNVFLANSREAIWQLQPVGTNQQANVGDGALFVLPTTGPNTSDNPVYLSNQVLNSFEPGDLRKTNWTAVAMANGNSYYYPYKYKIGKVNAPTTEYLMVLRLAEQYLIRAESRALQGNIQESLDDLNIIRARAGLPSVNFSSTPELLNAISHERQVELFTEWGHRWLDLKRTNTVNTVMDTATPKKGGTWSAYKALYPVSQDEIDKNKNLLQTPGY